MVDPRPVGVARTCAPLLTAPPPQEDGESDEAPEVSVEASEDEIVVRVHAHDNAASSGTSAHQSGGAGSTAAHANSSMP